VPQAAPLEVERRPLASLSADSFFEEFVRPRRPVVLDARAARGGPLASLLGLRGAAARWASADAEGTAAMREGPAGECVVAVERRQSTSAPFGQQDAAARRSMSLAEFCHELEAGGELSYLTTQPLPEDDSGCPAALAAPHVLRLLRGARRLRPKLVGKLVPVQYNLWFGRAAEGATSGLHHDFHDNIYVLLRGCKEFRLFSPRCVDVLQPAGAQKGRRPHLHANGLICYVRGIRDDGAPEAVARAWRGRRGAAGGGDSEEEERLLDMALEAEMGGAGSEDDGSGGSEPSRSVPDSFCRVSTLGSDSASSSAAPPVPAPLRGRHLTARLEAGDLLYLPASWFHEVISRGAGAGGHLALNLWLAPPHAGGTVDRPYEDGFWEGKYRALRRAAWEAQGRGRRRRRAGKIALPCHDATA